MENEEIKNVPPVTEEGKENSPKKEKRTLTQEEKRARSKKIRRIISLVVVLALVVGLLYRWATKEEELPAVETTEAVIGEVNQIVKTSGSVETMESKTYFAGVNAPVKSVNVATGDYVTAGTMLMEYDEDTLELNKTQAELSNQQANGSYSDSMERNADSVEKYVSGSATLPVYEEQLETVKAQIKELQAKIDAKTDRMKQTLYELQQTQLDINQDGIQGDSDNTKMEDGKEVSLQIQESINKINYELEHDSELEAWNQQLTDLKEVQSDLETKKSEAKSDKTSGESSKLTSGSQSSLSAQNQSSNLTNNETISDMEEAKEGVISDFNGIITKVAVVEGQTTANGAELFTIANADKLKINVELTKYDLGKVKIGQKVDITSVGYTYEGEVTAISNVATQNSKGTTVVATEITISNPDDNLIIGADADVEIHTADVSGVVIVPIEVVNTDSNGTFVYIVEDGVVVRRNVTVGVVSDSYEEITEGLSAGDQIITRVDESIEEGLEVQIADGPLTDEEEE